MAGMVPRCAVYLQWNEFRGWAVLSGRKKYRQTGGMAVLFVLSVAGNLQIGIFGA
jgi:hypothetical protein